jgi:Rieske Fe-S protein
MTTPESRPHLQRRALAGLATAGLALPVLAACGGGGAGAATDSHTPSSTPTGSGSGSPTTSGTPANTLAQTSDIQVGGGTIFPDDHVVVTQPTRGDFKCFSAVCTHQGCLVSSVSDGHIICECHGSAFSIEDGSVVNGPATQPLATEQITVEGGSISLA